MDPDELDRQARQLSAAASAVHRQAGRVGGAGRSTRWQGAAAEAFRAALQDDVARLRGVAERLEEAAAALHAHAAAVRERLAELAAARASALELAEDVLTRGRA